MKKYYLHNGTEQQGPFDIEDLKAKLINKDTPIWYDGLSDWTTADKIDELKDLFKTPPPFTTKQTPPPINKQTAQTETKQTTTPTIEPKKKSNVGKTVAIVVIVVIVLIVIVGGLAIFDNMSSGSGYGTGGDTYQEKVMTIEEIERATPTDFLSASGTYKENFWGDKFKVNVVITNKATVATYKDAVVRITYYSKTKTALGSKDYTIYETFPPNSTKTVELKIDNYKDVSSLGWDVIQATAN
jgi:hypothetical protein